MSNHLKVSLLYLVLCACLSGCEKKEPGGVKIAVKLNNAANAQIQLVTMNLLNQDNITIGTSRLDSTGAGELKADLDHPIFAFVKQGDQYTPVYISPGDEMALARDSSKTGYVVKFNGDGASVNQYMRLAMDARSKYEVVDGKSAIDADLKDFLSRRDALKKVLAGLVEDIEKDPTVDKNALQMMQTRNKMVEYFFDQNYVNAKYSYNPENPEIPAILKAVVKELPQDSLALSSNMYDYGSILTSYLHSGIIRPASDQMDSSDTDVPGKELPTFTDEYIESQPYSPEIKEYFKASNINFWVRMEGLSPEMDTLRAGYLAQAKNPLYQETIKKSFDQWAVIGPGKPAPDFTGITADGKKIALSSLKGKIVYVDVWATWCGPCREEFPESKKLMKEFEGNDKVAFLYLSTDQNIDKWKKLLPDKSIPAGIHIHQKQDKQPDAIWENYHLWGIPRYILIDAEGKMLQTHAPRPSSGKVGDLIRKHLKVT